MLVELLVCVVVWVGVCLVWVWWFGGVCFGVVVAEGVNVGVALGTNVNVTVGVLVGVKVNVLEGVCVGV